MAKEKDKLNEIFNQLINKSKSSKKDYYALTTRVPKEHRHMICPVCREDFTAPENRMAVKCPGDGCTLYYHDRGGDDNCWLAIDRCARPGCNGKQKEKALIKRLQTNQIIKKYVHLIITDQDLTLEQAKELRDLLRDNSSLSLSPAVENKVKIYLRDKLSTG